MYTLVASHHALRSLWHAYTNHQVVEQWDAAQAGNNSWRLAARPCCLSRGPHTTLIQSAHPKKASMKWCRNATHSAPNALCFGAQAPAPDAALAAATSSMKSWIFCISSLQWPFTPVDSDIFEFSLFNAFLAVTKRAPSSEASFNFWAVASPSVIQSCGMCGAMSSALAAQRRASQDKRSWSMLWMLRAIVASLGSGMSLGTSGTFSPVRLLADNMIVDLDHGTLKFISSNSPCYMGSRFF